MRDPWAPQHYIGNPDKIYPESGKFGWADITGQVNVRGVAATDPSWSQIGTSDFYAYKFGIGDYVWFSYHVPHDIVPNRDVHFHAHWITDGTATENVTWEFKYMYAKGFNQAAFNVTGTTVTASEAASGTAYQHMVTETTGQTISGPSEPDGLIQVRVGRIANATSPQADNTDGVFLLTADIHYQTTGQNTIGKAPNFYQD